MSTLLDEHRRGAEAALSRYGVKEAVDWGAFGRGALGKLDAAKRFLIGEPGQLLKGRQLFQEGQPLHWSNVFWPTVTNPQTGKKNLFGTWTGRTFQTILPAYAAYRALQGQGGDPQEGRLTNALSGLGGAIGGAYGFSGGGLLGSGLLSSVGAQAGKGVGRMLGSRAEPPPGPTPEQLAQMQAMYYGQQQANYPQGGLG